MRWIGVAALAATACGRLGFGAVGQTSDAPASPGPDAAPDSSPGSGSGSSTGQLTCNQATSSSGTVATTGAQLAVTTAASDIVAITTDSSQALLSWTFAVDAAGSAQPGAAGNMIASTATGTLGIAPLGGGSLAVWSSPASSWQTLDASAQAVGPVMTAIAAPASGAIAASGIDGTLALLEVGSNGEVDGVLLDASGAVVGVPVVVISPAIGAQSVRLAPAATGYVVTYTDPTQTVATREVMLLDAALTPRMGPVAASTDAFDAEDGVVAWAPSTQTYVAAWTDKTNTTTDVNLRVFDAQLVPLEPMASVIEASADMEALSSDGSGFWLASRGFSPNEIRIDYIAAGGAITAKPTVPADPAAMAMTVRNGQPVVTWLVQDALWVDGLCAQ
jgi:hypothetical protein